MHTATAAFKKMFVLVVKLSMNNLKIMRVFNLFQGGGIRMKDSDIRRLVRVAKFEAQDFALQLGPQAQSNVLVNGQVAGWSEDSMSSLIATVKSDRKRFGL